MANDEWCDVIIGGQYADDLLLWKLDAQAGVFTPDDITKWQITCALFGAAWIILCVSPNLLWKYLKKIPSID